MTVNTTPPELQATRDALAAVDRLLHEDHAALTELLARVQVTGGLHLFAEAAVRLLHDVLVLAAGDRAGAREVIADMRANAQQIEPGDAPPAA